MTDVSLDAAMTAQKALRSALGLAEERFPLPAFVGMISDEIEQLRSAGRDDAAIAALVSRAGVAITADEIGRYYAPADQRQQPGG